MGNAIIGTGNYSATLSTSTTWSASFPLNNILDRLLTRVALSTAVNPVITADLGIAKPVRIVGLIATTLQTSSTYTIVGSNNADLSSPVVSTGALSCATKTPNLLHAFSSSFSARYWRISLTNTSNVKIGRLYLGDGFQPEVNISHSYMLGAESNTGIVTSIGGAEFFNNAPVRRSVIIEMPVLTESEAMNGALPILLADVSNEVAWVRDPDDNTYNQKRHFMGRLRQLSALEHPYPSTHKAAFEILEIV